MHTVHACAPADSSGASSVVLEHAAAPAAVGDHMHAEHSTVLLYSVATNCKARTNLLGL
jgi:hypothetical protein